MPLTHFHVLNFIVYITSFLISPLFIYLIIYSLIKYHVLGDEEDWRSWAPDQTIINSYEPGEEIKPHIDSTEDWAGCVASLSLLDDWTMTFLNSVTRQVKLLQHFCIVIGP